MIAAVSTCDTSNWFNFVCNSIQSNDQSGLVGPFVEHLISAIAIFVVIYLLGRLTRVVVLWAMGRTKADRQVRTLVRNLITVTTYVVAVITALVVYGVNVAVILTAAGIGTVAVGLAFQDLLRNVLAGIWLLLEQPFRLGDVITVLDQTGAVQNITLRTTTLRTGVGELAILPNLTVFTGIVINSSHYDTRRLSVLVRLPVGVDIADVMRRARQAVEQVPGIDEKPGMLFEGEAPLLKCSFWVDQREQDPDAMTAAVAEQLWELVGTRPKRAKQASESSA
jgi:small-conductance mechanosensitive channel